MKYILVIVISVLLHNNAFAQTQTQSTALDRITFTLSQCIKSGEENIDKLSNMQMQLTQQQAEIKRLKDKYEPSDKK